MQGTEVHYDHYIFCDRVIPHFLKIDNTNNCNEQQVDKIIPSFIMSDGKLIVITN